MGHGKRYHGKNERDVMTMILFVASLALSQSWPRVRDEDSV